jgi:hypothetical protein
MIQRVAKTWFIEQKETFKADALDLLGHQGYPQILLKTQTAKRHRDCWDYYMIPKGLASLIPWGDASDFAHNPCG